MSEERGVCLQKRARQEEPCRRKLLRILRNQERHLMKLEMRRKHSNRDKRAVTAGDRERREPGRSRAGRPRPPCEERGRPSEVHGRAEGKAEAPAGAAGTGERRRGRCGVGSKEPWPPSSDHQRAEAVFRDARRARRGRLCRRSMPTGHGLDFRERSGHAGP